ncbi:hypothetical protein D3C77_393530 [compost metagenome]
MILLAYRNDKLVVIKGKKAAFKFFQTIYRFICSYKYILADGFRHILCLLERTLRAR